MKCVKCGNTNLHVTNSRATTDGLSIRRRRECGDCNYRFTTFETVEMPVLLVSKRDGDHESFDRNNIMKSILQSAEKQPVTLDQINQIVDDVENKLRDLGSKEVSSLLIRDEVAKKLKQLDQITYIRFLIIYGNFDNLDEVVSDLEKRIKM